MAPGPRGRSPGGYPHPPPMNLLKSVETTIANLVEGAFGRVFRSEVRPMEIARKLAREMDAHRTVSVSRVYVPNEYAVWLSPEDRERYEGVEHEVIDELCAYLLEHARGEDLALASRPHITFHTDEQLQLGEFGIEARMARMQEDAQESEGHAQVSPANARPEPPRPARGALAEARPGGLDRTPYKEPEEIGNTMIFSNSERVRDAVERTGARRRPKALLVVSGKRLLLAPHGATIGRSRECDVVLEDSSISRRHAELRPEGSGWAIEDLDSTNGVRVNAVTVQGAHRLRSGDRIEMGSTEILFEIAP
jgi:hypothetical protein